MMVAMRSPRSFLAAALGIPFLAFLAWPLPVAPASDSVVGDRPLRLDGDLAEWQADQVSLATPEWIWFRLKLDEEATLQGGTHSTRIRLDLDAKPDTGRKDAANREDAALGVDLEIWLNPPSDGKKKSRGGLEVRAFDDAGIFERVSHAAVDFAFAPSFAAREFEFRLARQTTLQEPAGSRYRAATRLAAAIDVLAPDGAIVTRGPRFQLELPPAGSPRRHDGAIPSRPDGAVRVLSWNVEWESPVANPAPFARVLAALSPDVVHLQEWKTSEEDLVAWFSANAPSREPWRAHTFKPLGVSIVTRLPMTPLTREPILPAHEVDGKAKREIRFVAARIETPLGPLVTGSMHLKCCGSKDSYEDRVRIAEAEAIHAFLWRSLAGIDDGKVILTGDMNLVGGYAPLATLGSRLDTDGSELAVADTAVLGDDAVYTWSEAKSPYSPGRLDYALYPDAALVAKQSFALDVARLSDGTRAAAKLEAGDAEASDHRPIVVDFAPRGGDVVAAPIEKRTAEQLLGLARDGAADVTLVNFWASWCLPCIKELPDLVRLAEELGPQKLRLILVTTDSDAERAAAEKILRRVGIDFPTYMKEGKDQEFITAIDAGWEGTLPFTVIFDRDGRKRKTHVGGASYEAFAADVAAAAAAPEGSGAPVEDP
jgi:thiol-disulfide isomerase/thioredoxin